MTLFEMQQEAKSLERRADRKRQLASVPSENSLVLNQEASELEDILKSLQIRIREKELSEKGRQGPQVVTRRARRIYAVDPDFT